MLEIHTTLVIAWYTTESYQLWNHSKILLKIVKIVNPLKMNLMREIWRNKNENPQKNKISFHRGKVGKMSWKNGLERSELTNDLSNWTYHPHVSMPLSWRSWKVWAERWRSKNFLSFSVGMTEKLERFRLKVSNLSSIQL